MIIRIALIGLAALLIVGTSPALAGDDKGPAELVHVPTDELDVLLKADRKGIVLRYAEYERLLAAAKARRAELEAQPPVDGTLVSCEGTLDLTPERAATMRLSYGVEVLADGPRSVDFPLRGFAIERLLIQDGDGSPSGRYEEWDGRPRLRFDEPGRRLVTALASGVFTRRGAQRFLDLGFPPASAMALTLRFPPGVEGVVVGEGAPVPVRAPSDRAHEVQVRPSRTGRLRVAFAPRAKGTDDGPAILDTRTNSLHTVGDGLVQSRVIVNADVFRTPVSRLDLRVPAGFAVRSLEGKGVTGFRRNASGERIRVDLDKPYLGTVVLVLEGERAYQPGPDVAMPSVVVADAVRHRAEMAVQFGSDVRVRGFDVSGGKRLAALRRKGQTHLLRYGLTRADGALSVDLEAGAVRLDASSTYYLNLAEAGKTLIVTTTYRVVEGTVFALKPKMPGGYELRQVTINGRPNGFSKDLRADGTLEIALARGVPAGGEISLAATLEQSQADWVEDGQPQPVPFTVPSAGAQRQEGLVAVGADAAFQVLESMRSDLVAVGAADLTARGISAAGLVYGYRIDGPKPAVALTVQRHEPVIDAALVSTLLPSPRRLDVVALVAHRIRRAGVRAVHVDVPAWAAEDQVRFESPFVRGAIQLKGEDKPDDVPAGYERWRVELNQRVIGRHTTVVRYHDDLDKANWRIAPERALGVRVPLMRAERFVVVQRAEGLEVSVATAGADVRPIEWTELPAEAAVDPLKALEVLRLANGSEGVGVSVQKHDGAAVLDAVAQRVALRTAVAREGVLRTRAWVHLFNVDRQFLKVSLPAGSDLIGAVVDGEAVKVLADPDGVLLVPIPTARKRTDLTVASLTYETKLDDELGSSVKIPGPVFHQLEVLRTEHEVAFDPDVHVAQVSGDYGRVRAPRATLKRPWIADILGAFTSVTQMKYAADGAAPTSSEVTSTQWERGLDAGLSQTMAEEPVIRDEEIDDHVETDNDLPYEESFGESEGLMDAPFEGPASNATIGVGGGSGGAFRARRLRVLERRLAEEVTKLERSGSIEDRRVVDEMRRALQAEKARGGNYRGPGAGVPPALREPSDASPPPGGPPPAPKPEADPASGSEDPARSADGPARPRGRAGRAHEHHEGDLPPGDDAGRKRLRRKGLLSLDVPVVLGPNVVVAQRLGSGGVIQIDLVTDEDTQSSYLWLGLTFLALGLLGGYRSRTGKLLVVVGGAALAVLLAVLFGSDGNTITVALANAVTLLAFVWAVRWLIARFMRRGTKQRAAVEAAASAGAAVLVVIALLAALAAPARADEPRPPLPKVKEPKKVYVPYDPADPTKARPSDRVFLPLETYLELFKAAHPEKDPELVELGRMVTLLDARYDVRLGRGPADMAEGTITFRFAKRGQGTVLVRWPLGGLAVTKATLDGKPVRLLLDKGVYRTAVTAEGDHTLELDVRVPIVKRPDGRSFAYSTVAFGRAVLHIEAKGFDGDVRVSGAGRVEALYQPVPGGKDCLAKAWLGQASRVSVTLAERSPAELPTTVRTRAESRTIHSIRDDGTETQTDLTVYVLQGRAPFVDVALPPGVTVLDAQGPRIVRWEALAQPSPRLRLTLNAPATGAVKVQVRSFRAAAAPERTEAMPDLALLDTTGESGHVIVNADPAMRVDVGETQNLFRIARPKGRRYAGIDGIGRVTGAWRFAARPARLAVTTRRIGERVDVDSQVAVVFGDDRVRTRIVGNVVIDGRAPVGTLAFALPGEDEVRQVTSAGMDTWWLEGEGDARTLHIRYSDLRSGRVSIQVALERRLGGVRDGIALPRWALAGARRDRGVVTLFALPDVELKVGSVPGLRSLPLRGRRHPATGIENARAVNVYAWDAAVGESLPVGLREPELETEAVVVTLVSPGDEEHVVEHLVLFDVRRGLTDQLRLFVPDGVGGEEAARRDVVTTRDLREMRRERVTRRDADGREVSGTLYDLRLQSPRDDVIEVTVSQAWRVAAADGARPVRLVRPEGVAGTLWFTLVRTFLDGTIEVAPAAGQPDPANFEDLPFVPAGLTKGSVYRSYASREPYLLSVLAQRHRLQDQASAVVQAAVATVVLGMDGQARVRVDYRVFNRARQFLRLKLPDGARLFGATTAGEPVKPLAGKEGTILLPIPKVPLGGKGYPVSVLYRAEAGPDFADGGEQRLVLPTVQDGVEVDRTVVRLFVPDGYAYDVESRMTATNAADVAADLAEVAVREARDLLKLAEKGTLSQRWAASQNGLALIAHARAKLNQAPDAWRRFRSLAGELNVLGKQLEKEAGKTRNDLETAQRQSQQAGPSVEEFASNARNLIDLDDVTNGLQDQQQDEIARKNKAAWKVNPSFAKAPTGKDAFGQVRERLKSKLQARGAQEERKNFKNVLDQAKQQAGGKGTRTGETWSYTEIPGRAYDAKQVQWLNDALKRDQTRNRQLGAVDTRILNTFENDQTMNDAPFEGPANNGTIGLRTQTATRADREAQLLVELAQRSSNYGFQPGSQTGQVFYGSTVNPGNVPMLGNRPSAGAYFVNGQDGDFRGRTENVFGMPLQAGSGGGGGGQILFGADADEEVEPYGKEGLMGVDVALPKVGKVYYFRGLRAGAPIELSPTKEGRSLGGRMVILFLILAAAGIAGVAVRKRRSVVVSTP
ncbi:MAG: hypothetical protein QNJ90_14130 [Planctomycetota bacterium]|nr:hypothetical protein [Planctomycetota bacterium]